MLSGLSKFMNNAKSKKKFILHKTSHFEVNNRITQKTALILYKFERLLSHKKFPNQLPVFINKDEINKEVVRLYNDEQLLHFRDIIHRLFEKHQTITLLNGEIQPVTLEGDIKLLKLAYDSGLGEKGSLKFGMIEAIHSENFKKKSQIGVQNENHL